ncbi:hypothetical protein D3C76_927160 [compost metagenome]
MIVSVVERNIEDGTFEGHRHPSHVVGTHLCCPQEVDIVQHPRRPVICPRKGREALHGYAQTIPAVKSLTGKRCQPIRQTEVVCVRGLDTAHAQALGVDHLDSTHLGMFFFGRELDQPCFKVRRDGSGKPASFGIAIDQGLRPCTLRRAAHQQQRLQELATVSMEHFLHFGGKLFQRDVDFSFLTFGCHGLKRHGAHRIATDVGQPFQ